MENIQIYLNSKRANRYADNNQGKIMTSDCIFHLPHINVKKTKHVSITVLHAQIPGSFYNVNDTNNKLIYSIGGGNLQTVYFENSNYNVNTLISHIKSLLPEFNVTYKASSNKFTFTYTTDFTFSNNSTCFELLGFSENDHVSHIINNDSILISDNVVNLFTIRTLHITSENFILNNIDSFNPNNANILASIPINTGFNGIISYQNIHDVHSEIHNTRNLTNLHIKITDQDGRRIDLNGAHWSITLMITVN